jgi:hypothetical protein
MSYRLDTRYEAPSRPSIRGLLTCLVDIPVCSLYAASDLSTTGLSIGRKVTLILIANTPQKFAAPYAMPGLGDRRQRAND